MLVTLTEILADDYAVIAPDFLTADMLRHYIAVAEQYNTPIIASYPPLAIDRLRPNWLKRIRPLCEASSVPVCLHLDHGKSIGVCKRAIKAGFTSVMIDASAHDFQTNLAMTREIVAAAKESGVSVEAEIGHVGGSEGSNETCLTEPDEAAWFAAESGADALAISIGTQHGHYRGEPHIDFKRLEEIRRRVDIPLVLHGGSGTGAENIRRAVHGGIRKINVFTDIIKPYLKASRPLPGRRAAQRQVVDDVLKKYFEISGSLGKA